MGSCVTTTEPDFDETTRVEEHKDRDEANKQLLKDLRKKFDSNENSGDLPFVHFRKIRDDEKEIDEIDDTAQTKRCDIDVCESLVRIMDKLQKHHALMKHREESENDTKSDIFDDTYNANSAVNDYHHLLFCHEADFECIHKKLVRQSIGQCSLKECRMMHRSYVDRSHASDKQLDDDTIKETVHNKLLDKMHCYYLHTFDIGYRLREQDQETLLNQEMKCNDDDNLIFDRVFINTQRILAQNNRLCKEDLGSHCFEQRNNRFNTEIETQEVIYDLGLRFFYWSYYEDNDEVEDITFIKNAMPHGENAGSVNAANDKYTVGDWYIVTKYSDLKAELLNNSTRTVSAKEYKILNESAKQHLESDYAKSLTAFGNVAYEIANGDVISLEHLLAMMTYCNKDALQHDLSETYRRRKDETDTELRLRHSEYANLGRLLREFSDCYGQSNIGNKDVGTTFLWHGISQQTQFASIKTRIKGPMSATTERCVAMNFAGGDDGLLLQFTLTHRWMYGNEYNPDNNQCAFIDCYWLSDYPHEQERFFIGGYDYLYVESIIIPNISANYLYYIQAMRTICETMQDSNKWFMSAIPNRFDMDIVTQLAFKLLSHELHRYYQTMYHEMKSIPPYVAELFHNFCVNTERIVFFTCPDHDFIIDYSYKTMKKICYSMFFYDSGLVKWDIVLKVFPSVKGIWIKGNCNGTMLDGQNIKLIDQHLFWWDLIDLGHAGFRVPKIEVDLYTGGLEERITQCKSVVEAAKIYLESRGWIVYLDDNCDHLLILSADDAEDLMEKITDEYAEYHIEEDKYDEIQNDLLYFETPAPFGQTALCSDNQCPCNEYETQMSYGGGYIYISHEVVELRKDCLTMEEFNQKLGRLRMMMPFGGTVVVSVHPIFMCKEAAELRRLDLEVASQDARRWWSGQRLPLRPTPTK